MTLRGQSPQDDMKVEISGTLMVSLDGLLCVKPRTSLVYLTVKSYSPSDIKHDECMYVLYVLLFHERGNPFSQGWYKWGTLVHIDTIVEHTQLTLLPGQDAGGAQRLTHRQWHGQSGSGLPSSDYQL